MCVIWHSSVIIDGAATSSMFPPTANLLSLCLVSTQERKDVRLWAL